MYTLKNIKKTSFILALFVITLFSCKKELLTDEITAVEDLTTQNQTSDDLGNIADQSAEGDFSSGTYGKKSASTAGSILADSIIITRDTPSVGNYRITVDFGTTGVLCRDGRTRKGKVIITYNGRYRTAGTIINTTTNNYYVNDNKVDGTRVVTNMGNNSSGQPYFSVSENGTITKASGGTITWNSTRTRTWTAGFSTLTPYDDSYSITGNATGTNSVGNSYTVNINSALVRNFSCSYHCFTAGVIEHNSAGKTHTVDFGNGACDNTAVMTRTANGRTLSKTITLR